MKTKIPQSLVTLLNSLKDKYKDSVVLSIENDTVFKFTDITRESDFFFRIDSYQKSKDNKLEVVFLYKPNNLEFYEEVRRSGEISGVEQRFENWIQLLYQFHALPELIPSIEKNTTIVQNDKQKLLIKNLKLFTELEVEIRNKVNIFLGKNAFGKTTLLQALALANIPDENLDTKSITFENYIRKGVHEANIEHYLNEVRRNITINAVNMKTANGGKSTRLQFVLVYGVNTFSKYNNMNYKDIIDKIVLGNEEKWYHTKSIFEDFNDNFYDPLLILNNIDLYYKTEIAQGFKQVIVKNLNKLLPDNLRLVSEDNLTYYFKDIQGNLLKTEQLSEGYRDNVILLTDIFIRIFSLRKKFIKNEDNIESIFELANGLIAIDEFDRHLHPSWQKVFVSNLTDVFKNVQFVLTTHNPLSILDREVNEIQELTTDNNSNIILRPFTEGTKKIDIATVLLVYFGLESVLSPSLQTDVNRFYELKTKNQLTEIEEAELENLSKILNNSFVGANVHDFRFLLFLKFLSDKGLDTNERLRELTISEEEADLLLKQFEEEYA